MAEGVLTNTGEQRILEWLRDPTTATPPVMPWKVRLLTALGSDTAAGTQATGSNYSPQTYAPGTPYTDTDGDMAMHNLVVIRFEALNASTIVGCEIWDSAGIPVRWVWGALVANVAVGQDAPFEFAIGKLKLKIR